MKKNEENTKNMQRQSCPLWITISLKHKRMATGRIWKTKVWENFLICHCVLRAQSLGSVQHHHHNG